MKNDQGCCGGICGVIVGVVVLLAIIASFASSLPRSASVIGLIIAAAVIYYIWKRNSEAGKAKSDLPPKSTVQGAAPAKTIQDIKVTISDVEASDKTETIKAILEEKN